MAVAAMQGGDQQEQFARVHFDMQTGGIEPATFQ